MDVNKEDGTAPFINNLEIIKIFKDEDKEKGATVMDLIN